MEVSWELARDWIWDNSQVPRLFSAWHLFLYAFYIHTFAGKEGGAEEDQFREGPLELPQGRQGAVPAPHAQQAAGNRGGQTWVSRESLPSVE